MYDTHALIDTRRRQANKSNTDFIYLSKQPLKKSTSTTVNHTRMNNNNIKIKMQDNSELTDKYVTIGAQMMISWQQHQQQRKITRNYGTSKKTHSARETRSNEIAMKQRPGKRDTCAKKTRRRRKKGDKKNRHTTEKKTRAITHWRRIFQELWRRHTTEAAKSRTKGQKQQ